MPEPSPRTEREYFSDDKPHSISGTRIQCDPL